MNAKEAITKALISKALAGGALKQGYTVKSADAEPNTEYLWGDSDDEKLGNKATSWGEFINSMSEEHKAQYRSGNGGELNEQNGQPPKMAAFASSSRFIYNLSTNRGKEAIPGFRFEEQLPTTIGGTANMDGYLKRDNTYFFVEAKCREPYSPHTKQTIKQVYRGTYDYVRSKMPRVFNCVMENCPAPTDGKGAPMMNVVFFCHGKIVAHFDIKQMISHLLGVATKFLKPENQLLGNDVTIRFLYLLYNPTSLSMDKAEKANIMNIYTDTCWCATHYHFEEMFGHIVDFLAPQLCPNADSTQLQNLKESFTFTLCDQINYRNYFK